MDYSSPCALHTSCLGCRSSLCGTSILRTAPQAAVMPSPQASCRVGQARHTYPSTLTYLPLEAPPAKSLQEHLNRWMHVVAPDTNTKTITLTSSTTQLHPTLPPPTTLRTRLLPTPTHSCHSSAERLWAAKTGASSSRRPVPPFRRPHTRYTHGAK